MPTSFPSSAHPAELPLQRKCGKRLLLGLLVIIACGYLSLLSQAWALAPGDTWDTTAKPRSLVVTWQDGYLVVDPKPDNKLQLYFLNHEKKLLPLPYARGLATVEYIVRRTQGQRPSTIPLVPSSDGLYLETVRPLQAPLKCYVRFSLTPSEPGTQATTVRTDRDTAPSATVYVPRIRLDE